MAGTDAGKSFNTFPLMNEQFIPEGYYLNEYGWKNIFENIITINFNHRWLAIITFIFISSVILLCPDLVRYLGSISFGHFISFSRK